MSEYTYEHHINIRSDALCPFKISHTICSSADSIANWHNNIEILFFSEGTASVQYGSERFDVKGEEMVIINSNALHRICNKNNLNYYLLIVDESFCRENGIDIQNCVFEKKFIDQEAGRLLVRAVESIIAYNKAEPFSSTKARCAVLNFLTYLCTTHLLSTVATTENRHFSEKYVKDIMKYLNEHFEEKIDLDMLASLCGITKFYLSREFKHHTGQTIFTYITMLKCKKAQLCLTSGMSVTETAVVCGFDNVSYFSQTYKKAMGVSPSDVKKQISQ